MMYGSGLFAMQRRACADSGPVRYMSTEISWSLGASGSGAGAFPTGWNSSGGVGSSAASGLHCP